MPRHHSQYIPPSSPAKCRLILFYIVRRQVLPLSLWDKYLFKPSFQLNGPLGKLDHIVFYICYAAVSKSMSGHSISGLCTFHTVLTWSDQCGCVGGTKERLTLVATAAERNPGRSAAFQRGKAGASIREYPAARQRLPPPPAR